MPYGGSDQISAKLRKGRWSIYDLWFHWCPGCQSMHQYRVRDPGTEKNPAIPDWTFDGNLEMPTFGPSMLIFIPEHADEDGTVHPRKTECHYFVTAGAIQFCGDSPHTLSGQTVPLPDLPPDYQN